MEKKSAILQNFLSRVRNLPSFWAVRGTQSKPSWFDNPKLVKAYRKRRKTRKRARSSMRRARFSRGQNPRTGAST